MISISSAVEMKLIHSTQDNLRSATPLLDFLIQLLFPPPLFYYKTTNNAAEATVKSSS